jgi:threonine dehydratase
VGALDALFVCVGGGGLISGCAVAARASRPAAKVIGVEPEAGNDVQQSLALGRDRAHRLCRRPSPTARRPSTRASSPSRSSSANVSRRRDGERRTTGATMRFFAERMKLVVEPTGCLAAAAVLEGDAGGAPPDLHWRGRRIGVIVSGGNVDLGRYAGYLAGDTIA